MWKRTVPFVLLLAAALALGCVGGRGKAAPKRCPPACNRCDPVAGCQDCKAGEVLCHGGNVVACGGEGSFGAVVKQCSALDRCMNGQCLNACEVASSSLSYIGCDYWPTTTANVVDPNFDFAVAVSNPIVVGDVVQGNSAHVKVTRGATLIAERDIAPGYVETILLPWVQELSQNDGGAQRSVLVKDGAYHLASSIPVTVYQFSPLQFEKPRTPDCRDPFGDEPLCHSFTNDASLLLPEAVLRGDYLGIARQTFSVGGGSTSGFLALVGTVDGTRVKFTSSAFTEPVANPPGLKPGDTATFTLDRGSVLQIVSRAAAGPCVNTSTDVGGTYCDLGPQYDLTGSRISADHPIAVFGGHACSFVPYNRYACDHLEEQLFPTDTWGQRIVVMQTEPQVIGEPNLWRVVSGSDNNIIRFDPPVYKTVTLRAGQYVEFAAEGGFLASGSGRVAVAQFMVGANYFGNNGGGRNVGDPSMGLGVPIEQFRQSYDFLTPATYTKSFVALLVPSGVAVTLDELPVTGRWKPIGATGYDGLRVLLKPGSHHVTASRPFGITVSGLASYTSYLFAGGLNLNEIIPQ